MAEPTSNSTTELLKLDVSVDAKKGLLEAKRFTSSITNNMKKIQGSIGKSDKGFGKFLKQIGGAKAKTKGIKDLNSQVKALEKVLKDRSALLGAALSKAKSAKRGSQERKDALEDVKRYKKTSGYGSARSARQQAKGAAKELQQAPFDWKDLNDGAEEAGESMSEPLRDLLSKDAPTLMRRMNKILMGSHAKAGAVKDFGARLSERGSKMMAGGGAMGKVGGVAAKAGGELTKLFGGLASVITSIGPILSVASSFMMSFVKILLDSEAAVKDFNKQILATTGTSSYLSRNLGDVAGATDALKASLLAAQKGALNMDNVMMGISKETAVAFESAITAEGVALDRLGNATGSAAKNADAHAKSIQAGVAYSRAFGVSLSEISQMQGQLMADLGMGAKTVQTSFQTIVGGAHEAGMETNKFFGIVRSFSSDLSLFTLRLAEVSKIMSVLGKTMDPRKMGQFLQTLNQKFSGGLMDNLKFEMLAGPDSKKIAKDDAADKLKNLTGDLKAALGPGKDTDIQDLVNLLKDPNRDPRKIAEWQAKHQKALNGTLNESIQDNGNIQTKLASGDKIDQASIMESLSPLAKLETLEAASMRLTGKKFDKLSGLSLAAVEATGIASAKEIQMFMKLKQGIMQGQEELISRVGAGGELSKSDKEQLAKLGVKSTDPAEMAKELGDIFHKGGGDKAYMASLDKTQRELLSASTAEIDYQKKIAELQTSMLDKLGMATDVILVRIYDMLEDIWKIIRDVYFSLPWVNGDKKDIGQAKNFASENNLPPELVKALGKSTSVDQAGEAVMATFGRDVVAQVGKVVKEYEGLKAKMATEKDPAKKKEIMDRYKAILPALKHASKDEKYLKNVNRTLGPKVMLQRLVEIRNALGGAPGAGPATGQAAAQTPAATATAAAVATPTKRQAEQTVKPQEATADGVKDLHRAVTSEGVKLAPASVSGPLTDAMSKSVYEGTAKALFEYYMYSGLDRSAVASAMGQNISPTAIAQSMTTNSGAAPAATLAALQASATKPNAMGGTVTGIMNGMAQVSRPAAGEGWASVGRGEKIVPAGGGGGGGVKVELELKGDLKRFIHARVVEGAAAHDRNKRLR